MARTERMEPPSQLRLGGLLVAGLVTGLALPKAVKAGRLFARTAGGMTYRSHVPGARPSADPARGRPA